MRNAISGWVRHTAGSGRTLPLKFASPWRLGGTVGVSTSTELPPPALPLVSHTRVPLTGVIVPRVPMLLPPASTNPATSNLTSPLARSTLARPPVTTHGWPPPVTAPVPEPTTFPGWITPTSASHRTCWAGTAMTFELKNSASSVALKIARSFVVFMISPFFDWILIPVFPVESQGGYWAIDRRRSPARGSAGLQATAASAARTGDAVVAAVELERLVA